MVSEGRERVGLWELQGTHTMGVSAPAHSLDRTVQGLYPSEPKDIPPQHHPGTCPDLHCTLGKGNGVVMVSCVLPQNGCEVTQHKVWG